jgi:tetratricopeptide (TPR) repeat protein
VYLIDPSSSRAGERIEAARSRQDEVERTIEHLLYEARSAADAGREDEALRIVGEVLDLQPNQLEAVELRDRISGPVEEPAAAGASVSEGGEAAPAVPSLPDLDDDLFDESLEATPEAAKAAKAPKAEVAQAPAATTKRAVSIRLIATVAAAIVVVSLGVWFGSQLISGGGDAGDETVVQEALAQARELRAEGRIEDAIALLQSVQVSGLDQQMIKNEIEAYQQAMVPPTPTPVPKDLVAARELFEAGDWLEAYRRAQSGLRDHPRDGELNRIKEQILEVEPAIGALYRAEESGDSAAALAAARQLTASDPDHEGYAASLDQHLFNAAVDQIKSHNLAGGTELLSELLEREPSDDEARQVLEFIETYKRRPSDMQLKVFIKSLSKR